jgi:hypothetical protein
LSRTERFLARWVGIREEDHRDWDDIGQWAASIGAELHANRSG